MKDYKKYAIKIGKMKNFGDIHNCGYPAEHFPVNLYFELAKNPACRMYVGYYFGEWLDGFEDTEKSVKGTVRAIMEHPLIPEDIIVRGFIIDSVTGELTKV